MNIEFKIAGGGNGGFIIILSVFLLLAVFFSPYLLPALIWPAIASLFAFALGSLFIGVSWLKFNTEESFKICSMGWGIMNLALFGVDPIIAIFIGASSIYIGLEAGIEKLCGKPNS